MSCRLIFYLFTILFCCLVTRDFGRRSWCGIGIDIFGSDFSRDLVMRGRIISEFQIELSLHNIHGSEIPWVNSFKPIQLLCHCSHFLQQSTFAIICFWKTECRRSSPVWISVGSLDQKSGNFLVDVGKNSGKHILQVDRR